MFWYKKGIIYIEFTDVMSTHVTEIIMLSCLFWPINAIEVMNYSTKATPSLFPVSRRPPASYFNDVPNFHYSVYDRLLVRILLRNKCLSF